MKHILILFAILLLSHSIPAQDFDELNNEAVKERNNKNYLIAIELCNQSLSKKTNARAYSIRANAYYVLGNFESAISDFSSALTYYNDYYGSDNKERTIIYYLMGRCRQKQYKYSDAISYFNSALTYNYSKEGDVYWSIGNCYYSMGKYKEADEAYQNAISKFSDTNGLSTLYENRADCKIMLRDYESAYSLYGTAITYNANNYSAYEQRGKYKNIDGKYEDALADYSKAIDILSASGNASGNDKLTKLYQSKANVLGNLDRYSEAILVLDNAIKIDPNDAWNYQTAAGIYNDMKNHDQARSEYEKAITLTTGKISKAYIYYYRSLMERGILNFKNSLADINKAIELNPESGFYFKQRSVLHGYKKNYPAAIKDCNTALELYTNDSLNTASLLWLRAGHKDKSGDYNGAKEDYNAYLKYYPESHDTYYELGRLFKMRLKNNDLANANFAKAARMALKAEDSSTYCYIKIWSGEKEEALKMALEMAEKYKDDKYRYKWQLHNLACYYSTLGNTVKGLEYHEKSMAAGFDDYPHLVTDRDLELLMKLPQWKTILAKYKVPVVKN